MRDRKTPTRYGDSLAHLFALSYVYNPFAGNSCMLDIGPNRQYEVSWLLYIGRLVSNADVIMYIMHIHSVAYILEVLPRSSQVDLNCKSQVGPQGFHYTCDLTFLGVITNQMFVTKGYFML